MIIEFEFTSQGNGSVRVFNNRRTASFTIVTHKYLPFTHSQTHKHLWQLNDAEKMRIETEIENHTREYGDHQVNLIVFGNIQVG